MAWNESRLWLVALGWDPTIEIDAARGVSLISFSRNTTRSASISPVALSNWFLSRGFRWDSCNYELELDGFAASIEDREREVSSIRATFTMVHPLRKKIVFDEKYHMWIEHIRSLERDWNFALLDPITNQRLEKGCFIMALNRTPLCEGIVLPTERRLGE